MMHLAEIYVEDDQDRLLNVATVQVDDIPKAGEYVALRVDDREQKLEVLEVLPPVNASVPDGSPVLEAMLVARQLAA